MHSALFTELES